MTVHGILLAAGAGRRMGRPKALVRADDGEPWLVRGVRALRDGGCDRVDVVLGARAEEALPLLDGTGAVAVVAADWASGMSASLRVGLSSVEATDAVAAVVTLVDLPDVGADVVRRLLADPPDAGTLRRAAYDGRPGHPVVLGRAHWAAVAGGATGDRGARDYLATRTVEEVECGDLAGGRDVDTIGG
ncbi:nucleotidyltransferase family protein [Nocardioides sp. YIM 152315]|uniref:nucleotidyltransferase family protein n=1 Tax=Nocardioides sp. YIM 152315 TaxID=3031760 RepID=UPI0023D9A5C5|nr:nucleotidyltransferase family protein [Nocardioides sp. YIM 152315]MDF1604871.1 nucleotidyltransferase family protein [Nocardioides sp. YIM 152315]